MRIEAQLSITVGTITTVVEQPRFNNNSVQTQLTLRNSGRVLLGTFKTPEMDGWTELHFLRAGVQLLK